MGKDAVAHLFSWIGGFLLLYVVSQVSVSQGGGAIESVVGLDARARVTSAYFAVLIIGVLLTIVCGLGIAHCRLAGRLSPKVPAVGLGDHRLKPGTLASGFYQGLVVLLIVLLPAYGLVHLNRKLADGRVWNEATPAGASLPLGCAMPDVWPFGDCPAAYAALAEPLLATRSNPGDAAPERTWLANHACDLVFDRAMAGPQIAERLTSGGDRLSAGERAAMDRMTALGLDVATLDYVAPVLAAEPPAAAFCAGPRDASKLCQEDAAACRGVEWLPRGSPVMIMLATGLGLLGSCLYLVQLTASVAKTLRRDGDRLRLSSVETANKEEVDHA